MSIWVRNHQRGKRIKPVAKREQGLPFDPSRPLAHLPMDQQFAIYEEGGDDHTEMLHPSFSNKFGTTY